MWLEIKNCLLLAKVYMVDLYVKFLFVFTNPSAGYDTRSIFKWNLTGLNSEFSFSKISCHTKVKKNLLPYYLLINWWENSWNHIIFKCISAMRNANSHKQDLNSGGQVHFLWWYPLQHLQYIPINHKYLNYFEIPEIRYF